LLVSQRPQRVFSFLTSRTQPKFAAALLYEPQTWRTGVHLTAMSVRTASANSAESRDEVA
jgi:hypothetical protein